MHDADLHWLAGLLEGEGTFLKATPSNPRQPSIAIQMTDEDVVARVAGLFGVTYRAYLPARNARWKMTYALQ